MSKLHNIKDKLFIVYYIVNDNYIGVTTDLSKRLKKHKSKSNFDVSKTEIKMITDNLDLALRTELQLQKEYKCEKGVRNQEGFRNPIAKEVLHLDTGIYFETIKEACESLNYNYGSVRRLIKNKNNKYNLVRL